MDYSKVKIEELRDLARKKIKSVNQKIRRLEKSGFADLSPSYRALNNKRFRIPRTNSRYERQQLSKTLNVIEKYFNMKTSSAKGVKSYYKGIKEKIQEKVGEFEFTSERQEHKFWNVYNRLREEYPYMVLDKKHRGTDILLQITSDLFQTSDKRLSAENLYQQMSAKLNEIEQTKGSLYNYFDKSFSDANNLY